MCAFEYHIFFRYHIIGDIFGRKFQLICKCATNNRLHPWRIATLNSKMDLDLRLSGLPNDLVLVLLTVACLKSFRYS